MSTEQERATSLIVEQPHEKLVSRKKKTIAGVQNTKTVGNYFNCRSLKLIWSELVLIPCKVPGVVGSCKPIHWKSQELIRDSKVLYLNYSTEKSSEEKLC